MSLKVKVGAPFAMKDAVAYEADSIVSKIVVDKKVGSLTLFAFDAGQKLSEHSAPFDAIVEIIDGKAEVVLDGTPHILHEGQAIIMPANVPHGLNAPERFKMLLTMIRSS